MSLWQFIQDQILGMKWLSALIGKGLSALGLDVTARVGGSIQFPIFKATFRRNGAKRFWDAFTGLGRISFRLCWER